MRIGMVALLSIMGMITAGFAGWQVAASRTTRPTASREPPANTPQPVTSFRTGDSLVMEGRLGHAVLRASEPGESYLYAEMRADANKLARTLASLNLAIVLDRSRTIRGKKLDNAIAAARGAVARLRDGDAVSVLSYNTA